MIYLRIGMLTFFLSVALQLMQAQPNLVMSKPGSTRHYYFQVGDAMTFRDSLGIKQSGVIISLNDSMVGFARMPLMHVSNIRIIYRHRFFFTKTAELGVAGVLLFLPISVINRALQGDRPWIGREQLITHSAVLGATGISLLFLNRKYRIGNPWKLQILDFGRPVYK